MQIQVKDSGALIEGFERPGTRPGWKLVTLDDNRLATLSNSMRMAGVFYPGSGEPYNRGTAQDAVQAEAFQIGQLTYLEAKAIAKWYDPMMFEKILGPCLDYSAGPWAKTVDYLSIDGVGVGEFVGPDSTYFPMVDVFYEKASIGVGVGQIGYQYTQEDLRTSAYLKQPLTDSLQTQAVLAYKRHSNYVALLGDPRKNFTGLYNNGSATAANRLSGAVWDSATADTIVADIIDGYAKYIAGTANNEQPSVIIFPTTSFQKLLTPRSVNSDTTIKKFIEETLQVTIMQDILLDTTANGGTSPGSGSTKRVVYAAPKNDNAVFHIPMPITFLPPQYVKTYVMVPAEYKLGGFELRRVQTVRYMDGV